MSSPHDPTQHTPWRVEEGPYGKWYVYDSTGLYVFGGCTEALARMVAARSVAGELYAEVDRVLTEEMAHWPTCPSMNDYSEDGWKRCNCHLKKLRDVLAKAAPLLSEERK